MVDMKTETELTPRQQRQAERAEKFAANNPKMRGVRVVAGKPEYQVLKHPMTGMSLRSGDSVEWPYDRFTQRRLADGSVKLADETTPSSPPPDWLATPRTSS